MRSRRLAGSVCLVTGATGGIGRAIAVGLGARDVQLLLSGREEQALADVVAESGGTALATDLAEFGAGRRLAALALEAADHVDVLVNCAGIGLYGPAEDLEPDELERLFRVNVLAPMELTSALLPGMVERRRGHIVNVGSIAGRLGRRREAAYAASKAALSVFSDSLRAELSGSGVAVSLVTPGVVNTRYFERRSVPYDRGWPKPIPADAVAARVVRALDSRGGEVIVPRWLSFPMRLRGVLPGLYDALARRFD
jgi:uncharacterized protein